MTDGLYTSRVVADHPPQTVVGRVLGFEPWQPPFARQLPGLLTNVSMELAHNACRSRYLLMAFKNVVEQWLGRERGKRQGFAARGWRPLPRHVVAAAAKLHLNRYIAPCPLDPDGLSAWWDSE